MHNVGNLCNKATLPAPELKLVAINIGPKNIDNDVLDMWKVSFM